MFASLLLMFGDAVGIALCLCLIAAILIQLVLSLMRNLIMARSKRIGVTKKEEVLEPMTANDTQRTMGLCSLHNSIHMHQLELQEIKRCKSI